MVINNKVEIVYWKLIQLLDCGKIELATELINTLDETEKKIFSTLIHIWQYRTHGRRELEKIVRETENPWGYFVLSELYIQIDNHSSNEKLFSKFLREYETFNNSLAGNLLQLNQIKVLLEQGLFENVLRMVSIEDIILSNVNNNVNNDNDNNRSNNVNNNNVNNINREFDRFLLANNYYLVGKAKLMANETEVAINLLLSGAKIFDELNLNYYSGLCYLELGFATDQATTELISYVSQAINRLEKTTRDAESKEAINRLNSLNNKQYGNDDKNYYQIADYYFISERMKNIRRRLAAIAADEHNVMILGERGTGKEGIAETIHLLSERKHKPFVKVNLSSLSKTLFNSQLFGHEKGAFTGADKLTFGPLDHAQGGTLFMDEIGELPEEHQVTLLDVIYKRRFKRVGSNKEIPIDIKFIAATNQNLEKLTEKEQQLRDGNYQGVELQNTKVFRADLFDRFVWCINLPNLSQRRDEIPRLIDIFLKRYIKRDENITFSKFAENYLANKKYPGNIRSLESEIIKIISEARVAGVKLITEEFIKSISDSDNIDIEYQFYQDGLSYSEHIDRYRHNLLSEGMHFHDSSTKQLAKSFQIPERTLYNYLNEFSMIKKGRKQ
ncbi:MAG: sigma 54-interacting transcriptional regulator [Blastocatellia bacterium]